MTIEKIRYVRPEDKIKLFIAKWTGLPKPDELPINNNIAPGNLVATRPLFEKEAEFIYFAVDKVVFVAEKIGIIK